MDREKHSIFCQIRSHSHFFEPGVFEMLERPSCHINVYDVKEDTFFLGIHSEHSPPNSRADFNEAGTFILSEFLIALNVGSMGHFEWAAKTAAPPTYSLFNKDTRSAVGLASARHYKYPEKKSPLTNEDLGRAVVVFEGLCNEPNNYVRTEYLKGIYHLGLEFFDLTFRKDAFANFYRAFEHFVTDRVLRVAKLTNELKQMAEAMRQVGLPESMVGAFGPDLYRLRCEQVMHSQKQQVEITWEDAAKMKAYADTMMLAFYFPPWAKASRGGLKK
ncbi:MAG: hypothetical protein ABMA13_18095 [Chthoniobacteraceae bacterium]